jgi:hypothetical protein
MLFCHQVGRENPLLFSSAAAGVAGGVGADIRYAESG